MFKKFICAALIVLSVFAISEDLFAKGGRGGSFGGGRSSGGFSGGRSSAPSPSRSFGGSRSSSPAPAPSTKVSNPAAQSTPKPTVVQNKAYAAAKTKGLAFSNKADAQADFKAKHAQTYTSKYATEPKTRPEHIPATTNVGGTTYNINYNSQYGGYGYTNALGAWIAYDMMSDAIMMNSMMSRHGYYVGSPTTTVVPAHGVATVPVVYSHGPGYYIMWFFIITVFVGSGILLFVCFTKGY